MSQCLDRQQKNARRRGACVAQYCTRSALTLPRAAAVEPVSVEGSSDAGGEAGGGEAGGCDVRRDAVVAAVPFFYGHLVLVLCTLARVLKSFGQNNTLFLSVPGVLADVPLTRTQLGLLFVTACLFAATLQPLFGRLLDRHGCRRCIPAALLALSLSLCVLASAQSGVAVLTALLGLRSFGLGALDTFTSTTVGLWYTRTRGAALAWLTVGFYTFTGAGTVQVLALTQRRHGWRCGLLVAALLCALAAPLCALLLRVSPHSCGLLPDGDRAPEASETTGEAAEAAAEGAGEAAFTRSQALRTPLFVVLAAYTLVYFLAASGTDFHLVAMAAEVGTVNVAATLSLATGISAGLCCLLVGKLLDRGMPALTLLAVGGALLALYCLLLTALVSAPWAVLTGVVKGCADACAGVSLPFLHARVFGSAHAGAIYAINRTMGVVGSGLGPLLFGMAHDSEGSFRHALFGVATMPFVAAFAAMLVRAPTLGRAPEVHSAEEQELARLLETT